MLQSRCARCDRYTVIGCREGYHIFDRRTGVTQHTVASARGITHDAFTNTQRGVQWLVNMGLVPHPLACQYDPE